MGLKQGFFRAGLGWGAGAARSGQEESCQDLPAAARSSQGVKRSHEEAGREQLKAGRSSQKQPEAARRSREGGAGERTYTAAAARGVQI